MRGIKISQQDFVLKRWGGGGGGLMRDGGHICRTLQYMYVHPTWWLCGVHTYIPFRYDAQVGHTHNAYPAPGRMDTVEHSYILHTLST